MKRFWLVWNDNGRQPTCRHYSLESARQEAERLARSNVGARFHVLETVTMVTSPLPAVEWEAASDDLSPAEIPF